MKIIRMCIVGGLAIQIFAYVLIWKGWLVNPAIYISDFASFYVTGRMVREGNAHALYDSQSQYNALKKFIPSKHFPDLRQLPSLPPHPQVLAPLLALISLDAYVSAYKLWSLVNVGILGACGALIFYFLISSGWDPHLALLASASACCFYPAFTIVLKGQDTAFILLGYLVWMIGLLRHRETAAGFGLSAGIIAPQVTAPLALIFLASKRRAVAWFFIACTLILIYFYLLVGAEGIAGYAGATLSSLRGKDYAANQVVMFNLTGLLLRLAPGLGSQAIHMIGWLAAFLSIIGFFIYWLRNQARLSAPIIGLTVLASLFFAPHLHGHSLSFLLLPWMAAASCLRRPIQQASMVAFLTAGSIALLCGDAIADPWRYYFVYILFGGLAWILVKCLRNAD